MTTIPKMTFKIVLCASSQWPIVPTDSPTKMNTTLKPSENRMQEKKMRTRWPARRSSSCSTDRPDIIER